MSDIADLLKEALVAAEVAADLSALDEVRVRYLGKKGALTAELKSLGKIPAAQRRAAGQAINEAKQTLLEAVNARRDSLQRLEQDAAVAARQVDVTLPSRGVPLGSHHPVTRTTRRIRALFAQAGFEVHTGPEIEDEYHNFSALNIPDNHPARAMHDTFYLNSGLLLRTHTSPVQVRSLTAQGAPIRIIAPGRVFRCDSDQTHTPMFHQVEGLAVGRDITFANLKGLLYDFVGQFFEREVSLRFRPSYFPFTEPSAEVDVLSESGRWLEILGCGMVHPNMLRHCGVDPEEFTGYAFGIGIERLAMLRYGVDDLRLFFDNDVRFLAQFV